MKYRIARYWTMCLFGLAAIATTPSALAGGNGYRHDGYQLRGGYHYDRGRGYLNRNYQNRSYRERRYHPRRHDHRNSYRGHYRQRSRNNRGAYLAGGIILGSVITHALTRPPVTYDDRDYRHTRVIRESRRTETTPTRRLFRDRDGNCYERSTDAQGDEVLFDLPRSECAW